MKMIVAAIVVVVIIVIGALALSGSGKKAAQQSTTIAAGSVISTGTQPNSGASQASTTAPATTGQAASSNSSGGSLSALAGQNLTVGQFARDIESTMYGSAPNQLNITYRYRTSIVSTGSYAFSFNSTGQMNAQTYFKSLRITTASNSSGGSSTIVYIYNATSRTYYACTSAAGSPYNCYVSARNVSQSNVSSLGYFGSLNSTASGYISNVKISDSSYNGQPCTQVGADLHVVDTVKGMPTTTDGTLGMCFSQQNGVLLTMDIQASAKSTSGGNTYASAFNYSDNEVSMSGISSASITNLPGPLSGG